MTRLPVAIASDDFRGRTVKRIEAKHTVLLLLLMLMTNGLLENRVVSAAGAESPAQSAMSDEKRLIKYLLDNYERVGVVGRPVFNTSMTIRVNFGLALIQILDLDEKNQVLTTNVWSRYVWNDTLLKWNPEDFGDVNYVRVPIGKIWTPDIVLYNYADTRLKEHREAMAVISYDGSVLWIPPSIFRSSCQIDITHFPYDVQTCHLKFGSWTFDGFKLDLGFYEDQEEVDISNYIESNEWQLVGHPARRNVKYYACCPEPYPDLTFTITIKRVAVFYSYILVLPCLLLSFITLVIFWLPPESPAKMMLGMNVFVAFFVLLLLLADNTPPAASTIPLIGAYFCMNMVLITLSSFLAIFVINNHIRGDRKNQVPWWLRRITIEGLARVMCMNEYLDDDKQSKQTSKNQEQKESDSIRSKTRVTSTSVIAEQPKSSTSGIGSSDERTAIRLATVTSPRYGDVKNCVFSPAAPTRDSQHRRHTVQTFRPPFQTRSEWSTTVSTVVDDATTESAAGTRAEDSRQMMSSSASGEKSIAFTSMRSSPLKTSQSVDAERLELYDAAAVNPRLAAAGVTKKTRVPVALATHGRSHSSISAGTNFRATVRALENTGPESQRWIPMTTGSIRAPVDDSGSQSVGGSLPMETAATLTFCRDCVSELVGVDESEEKAISGAQRQNGLSQDAFGTHVTGDAIESQQQLHQHKHHRCHRHQHQHRCKHRQQKSHEQLTNNKRDGEEKTGNGHQRPTHIEYRSLLEESSPQSEGLSTDQHSPWEHHHHLPPDPETLATEEPDNKAAKSNGTDIDDTAASLLQTTGREESCDQQQRQQRRFEKIRQVFSQQIDDRNLLSPTASIPQVSISTDHFHQTSKPSSSPLLPPQQQSRSPSTASASRDVRAQIQQQRSPLERQKHVRLGASTTESSFGGPGGYDVSGSSFRSSDDNESSTASAGSSSGTSGWSPPMPPAPFGDNNAESSGIVAALRGAGVRAGLTIRASPAMEADLNDIRSMLNLYLKRLETKDVGAKVTKEWRVVARVFDHLFFYTYIATIIVSLATIFPRAHD